LILKALVSWLEVQGTGKDENGENKYERLITFKPMSKVEVEPLPEKVLHLAGYTVHS
jgi:hypothetical protein